MWEMSILDLELDRERGFLIKSNDRIIMAENMGKLWIIQDHTLHLIGFLRGGIRVK